MDEINKTQDEINKIQDEINNIGGEINNIRGEINHKEGLMKTIEDQIIKMGEKIKTIQHQISIIDATIAKINGMIESINTGIYKLNDEIDQNNRIKITSTHKRSEYNDIKNMKLNDLNNINNQMRPFIGARDEAQRQLDIFAANWWLKSLVPAFQAQVNQFNARINELNNIKISIDNEIINIDKQKDYETLQITNAENQIINKQNEIVSLTNYMNNLKTQQAHIVNNDRVIEGQNYSYAKREQHEVIMNKERAQIGLGVSNKKLNDTNNRLNDANNRLNEAKVRLNDQKIAFQRNGEIIGKNITSAYNNATKDQIAAFNAYQNRSQSTVSSPAPAPSLAPTSFSPATISEDQLSQARSELAKYQAQLEIDTRNNDITGIENSKNRIQQYENIIAGK